MVHHWLLGLMLLGLPFWWGEAEDLQLVDAMPLADVVGEDRLRNPILSPDGTAVAWNTNDGVCVHEFESASTTCSFWPEEARLSTGRYNLPVWSPDGERILYHEDFFLLLYESDLWAFDVAAGRFTNLTDDGVSGGTLSPDDGADVTVDLAPFFSPTTGDLYFWRLDVPEEGADFAIGEANVYLMTLNEAGDAEEVRLMSGDVPGPTSIFGPGVFSDDGSTIYVTVMPPDWHANEATGVYTLDLRTGVFEPVSLSASLVLALPEWARGPHAIARVQTAGSDGLVVWLEDLRGLSRLGLRVPVYIDLKSGRATTVIDYGDFADEGAILAAREGDDMTIYDTAIGGAVQPGGGALWMLVLRNGETAAIVKAPLPPGDAEPEVVASFNDLNLPRIDGWPTFGGDKLLLYDLLLTLAPDA